MTTTLPPGTTLRDLRALCDAEAVRDGAFGGNGYHESQFPWSYDPAFEQSRDTWFEFLEQIAKRELNGTFLQIGLGAHGGTHRLFGMIAASAVCVELDAARVAAFDGPPVILGDSTDPAVIEHVRSLCGGCDLVLLDGDDSYESLRSDWLAYAPLVRPGGVVAVVDGSQDRDYDGALFDASEFVRDLDTAVLRPRGVRLRRLGADRAIHFYEQPDDSIPAVLPVPATLVPTPIAERLFVHEGFALWRYGHELYAIDARFETFERRAMQRGAYGDVVRVGDVRSAREALTLYATGCAELRSARELIVRGDCEAARILVESIRSRFPELADLLVRSLDAFAYAREITLALGTLRLFGEHQREGVAWFEAALEHDVMNSDLLQLVAKCYLGLLDDDAGARRVLERARQRVARARIRGECHRMLDASPGLWRYPQLLEGITGVIQVGAHRGEELDAFARVELRDQVFFEPHPDAFDELRTRCQRRDEIRRAAHPWAISDRSGTRALYIGEDSSTASLFEARAGGSDAVIDVETRSLDGLIEDGVIDPARFDVLVIDAEGAELEVLQGARRLLESIRVICVAVHHEPIYVGAPTPAELSTFLARCDDYGFALRAHDREGDPRRGNAIFTRCTRRRRTR